MNPGHAITQKSEDAFERGFFVERLAEFLQLKAKAPSIAVGLEAKWGHGKTSCINLLKEYLKESPDNPLILHYEPWLLSNLESVVEGFFVQIASEIGEKDPSAEGVQAAKKVLGFAKMMAPIKLIPGVEPWGSIVQNVLTATGDATQAASELSEMNLRKRKEKVQEGLEKLGRPIIVVIDDVDRLPPEQIRIIFQMLKTVGDLNRVAYLVAYDPNPVEKALCYGDLYIGRDYLEKIIQVVCPVPRLSFINMRDYFSNAVLDLLEELSLEMDDKDQKLWQEALNQTDMVRSMNTPRDTVRICNRLRLSAPLLKGEVFFTDLVVFETIAIRYPELYKLINESPEFFMVGDFLDAELNTMQSLVSRVARHMQEREGIDRKTKLSLLLENDSVKDYNSNHIQSILKFLFPNLEREEEENAISPKHIRNRNVLLQALQAGAVSFVFTSKTALAFINNPDVRLKLWEDYQGEMSLSMFLAKIGRFINSESDFDFDSFVEFVCEALKAETRQPGSLDPTSDVSIFLKDLLGHIPDKTAKWEAFLRLLTRERDLALSEKVLLRYLGKYSIWDSGKYYNEVSKIEFPVNEVENDFTYEQLYEAKDIWLDTVRAVSSNENILRTQRDVVSILYRWLQLAGESGEQEVHQYLRENLKTPEDLEHFFRLFYLAEQKRIEIIPFLFGEGLAHYIERLENELPNFEYAQLWLEFLRDYLKRQQEAESIQAEADAGIESDAGEEIL